MHSLESSAQVCRLSHHDAWCKNEFLIIVGNQHLPRSGKHGKCEYVMKSIDVYHNVLLVKLVQKTVIWTWDICVSVTVQVSPSRSYTSTQAWIHSPNWVMAIYTTLTWHTVLKDTCHLTDRDFYLPGIFTTLMVGWILKDLCLVLLLFCIISFTSPVQLRLFDNTRRACNEGKHSRLFVDVPAGREAMARFHV